MKTQGVRSVKSVTHSLSQTTAKGWIVRKFQLFLKLVSVRKLTAFEQLTSPHNNVTLLTRFTWTFLPLHSPHRHFTITRVPLALSTTVSSISDLSRRISRNNNHQNEYNDERGNCIPCKPFHLPFETFYRQRTSLLSLRIFADSRSGRSVQSFHNIHQRNNIILWDL